MRRYLVTGITGTLGRAVSADLLVDPDVQVVGYSRDELKQKGVPSHPRLTLYLGDIRDRDRLIEASRGCDRIYHFAALKHVDLLESNPEEAIRTNVEGTQNVLHAQRVNKISRVILSATDKGCLPINCYGATKLLSEKLVLRNPNNVVCRYGNVIASRGSAIPIFAETLIRDGVAYVTDDAMTRFFIRIQDAARFVMDCANEATGGLRIPEMKSARMVDVVASVARLVGVDKYEVKYMGIRPGEKIHEDLRAPHEGPDAIRSDTAPRFTPKELDALLAPIVKEMVG